MRWGYRFGMADGASPSLAEVMAAMSIAVDIGMGQPMEQGLGVCLLAVRFGELVGLGSDELQEVFEVALLRHIGCTAEAADLASIMGDELLARATGGPFVDWANPSEALRFLLGHLVRSLPPAQAAYKIARLPAAMPRMRAGAVAVCEVASLLAGRFAMPDRTRADLVTVYERWDGKGFPGRLSGEAIPLCGRIVQLAETAWVFAETAGADAAAAILRRRSGTALDPQLVERFSGSRDLLLAGPRSAGSLWEVTPQPRAQTPTPADPGPAGHGPAGIW